MVFSVVLQTIDFLFPGFQSRVYPIYQYQSFYFNDYFSFLILNIQVLFVFYLGLHQNLSLFSGNHAFVYLSELVNILISKCLSDCSMELISGVATWSHGSWVLCVCHLLCD